MFSRNKKRPKMQGELDRIKRQVRTAKLCLSAKLCWYLDATFKRNKEINQLKKLCFVKELKTKLNDNYYPTKNTHTF